MASARELSPADWLAEAASLVASTPAGDRVAALVEFIAGCVRATRARVVAPRGESVVNPATWSADDADPGRQADPALRRRALDTGAVACAADGRVLPDVEATSDAVSLLILRVRSSGVPNAVLELEGEVLHLASGAVHALHTLCTFVALSLESSDRHRAIAEVAGGIAHDLNNHLTAVNGLCEVVLEDEGLDEHVREDLTYVRAAGEQAAVLTQQLLAFSGRQMLQRREVEVDRCVEQALPSLRRLLGDRARLDVMPCGVPAFLNVDFQQVTNVLLMLAANALDAGASAMRLEASVPHGVADAAEPGTVRIAVSDNGRGMSPELQSRAFTPFFTTKRQLGHVGLGLCAASGLLRQFGATIDVTSREGAGTTVELRFPRVAGDRTSEAIDGRTTPATVLLVDRRDEVRHLAGKVLRADGHTVIEARNVAEARRQVFELAGRLDVLVADLELSDGSGEALARAIEAERPGIRVLLMSGNAATAADDVHGGENHEWLSKPFTAEVFRSRVREMVHRQPRADHRGPTTVNRSPLIS